MVYRPIAAGTPPRLPVHGETASDQAAGQATHRRLPRGKAGHRQAAPPSLARDKQGTQIAQLGREANDQANDQTAVHIGGSARVLPNFTITEGNTVRRLSPMPSVD
jgi:hypothetical protein